MSAQGPTADPETEPPHATRQWVPVESAPSEGGGGLIDHIRALGDPWKGLHRPPMSQLSGGDTAKLVIAGLLVGLSFLAIFGGPLIEVVLYATEGKRPLPDFDGIIVPLVLSQMALFVIPPVAWAALAYPDTARSVSRRLLLDFTQAWRTFAIGAGAAVIFLIVLVSLLLVVDLLVPGGIPENELALEIGRGLTPPLILLLAFGSAAGEELFFRAFLQRRLGLVATSVVFGLVHISYWNVLQVVIPAVLALFLGYLLLRYRTVVAPFAAHFTFNFIQLVGIYVADEGYTAGLPLVGLPALVAGL